MLEGLDAGRLPADAAARARAHARRVRRQRGRDAAARTARRRAPPTREVGERVDRLCRALESLGVEPGDRVATFMWNSQEHLEVYLACPCMGAVLHTLNIRLFPEQLTYIANHAEDRVVFVDDSLVPVLEKVAPTFETVEHYVDRRRRRRRARCRTWSATRSCSPTQDAGLRLPRARRAHRRRPLLHERHHRQPEGRPLLAPLERPALDRRRASPTRSASRCVGPRAAGRADVPRQRVGPARTRARWSARTSSCRAASCRPSRSPKLIEDERVTIAGAVPTIWMDLLRYADEHKPDLSSLRTVDVRRRGRAGVADARLRGAPRRRDHPGLGHDRDEPARRGRPPARRRRGRGALGYRARDRPHRAAGRGAARWATTARCPGTASRPARSRSAGPWIASDYYNDPTGAEKFHDGWLRTGDVASIDSRGFMRITDRAKDVIKSGGEWISSVELENALMAHPDVARGRRDREARRALDRAPAGLRGARRGRARARRTSCASTSAGSVAKWWMPDEFAFIDEVPKTSVGKFDKKVLRKQLAEGELEAQEPVKSRVAGLLVESGRFAPAAARRAALEPSDLPIHASDDRHGRRQARIQAQDPRRRGQARPRRARSRREDHRPRAARCRHGGDLHRPAPDAGADRRDRDPGGRRRGRPLDPLGRPHDARPAGRRSCSRKSRPATWS